MAYPFKPQATRPQNAPIVHFGPGHFFRGHLAEIASRAGIGIAAVSMRSSELRDTLAARRYEYPVIVRGENKTDVYMVNSLRDVLVAPEDPLAVVSWLAHPETEIVTMTITQEGYDEALRIARDSRVADEYREQFSTIGYITEALRVRYQNGEKPFMVMSLDNIVDNGKQVKKIVLKCAKHFKDRAFSEWIENEVPFPSTMVDRIVPSTEEDSRQWARDNLAGDAATNPWPIFTEKMPHLALVIADHQDHPLLKRMTPHGAHLVCSIGEFSKLKIRMLNGAHMSLGMLGQLVGYKTPHEAMNNPAIAAFVNGFMEDARCSMDPVDGVRRRRYKREIDRRLRNENLPDELSRLARNGHSKIKDRIFRPLVKCISKNERHGDLARSAGLWALYLRHGSEGHDISDTVAQKMGLLDLDPSTYLNAEELVNVPGFLPDGLDYGPEFVDELQAGIDLALGLVKRSREIRSQELAGFGLDGPELV